MQIKNSKNDLFDDFSAGSKRVPLADLSAQSQQVLGVGPIYFLGLDLIGILIRSI